jgi:hypothetical protein
MANVRFIEREGTKVTSRISLVSGWMLPNMRWKNILCNRAGVRTPHKKDSIPFKDSATRPGSVLSSTISIEWTTGVDGISPITV